MTARFYFAAIITFLLVFYSCNKKEDTNRPNIIFIMSDDHAEKAISSYSQDLLATPNIDRIAEDGVRFTNSFVTNSICAPSRAVLLTGLYSHLNGLRDNRDQFDGQQVTFPKLLQKAGYKTAMIGKWHLKTAPTGFDHWNILIGQGDYYNPLMVELGDTSMHTGYTTDLITDFALSFLRSHKSKDQPFCLLLHNKAPHRNWMPPPRYFDLFKDKEIPLPSSFYDKYEDRLAAEKQDMRIEDMFLSLDLKIHESNYDIKTGTGGGPPGFSDHQAWTRAYGRLNKEQKSTWDAHYDKINQNFREIPHSGKSFDEWKYRRYMEDYLGSVAAIDDNIGRILDFLDQSNLLEETLIIYTSDQGFYLGEHGWYDKRFMYEESLRTPLVMSYPSRIDKGQVRNEMVLNLDLAPTILDYAQVPIPEFFQGASLQDLLDQKHSKNWRTSMYYQYFEFPHGWHSVREHYGIRTERYKLIHFGNDIDEWELFDLDKDPTELKNLYNNSSYSNVKEELHKELRQLQQTYQVNTEY